MKNNQHTLPPGVKARLFGSDVPFLRALRHHPRFQNRFNEITGIAVTDCDVIVSNYKQDGLKDIACVQIIELKSRNAEPDYPQRETYRLWNLFKGKRGKVINYGASFVSYDGDSFENSRRFRWGRFKDGVIIWRQVDRETMFDLVTMLKHPDTLTNRKLFRDTNHGTTVVCTTLPTQLGFITPVRICNAY